MSDIKKIISENYPAWHARKSKQPTVPRHIRKANGSRPNATQVAMRPEYITQETPQA